MLNKKALLNLYATLNQLASKEIKETKELIYKRCRHSLRQHGPISQKC